MAEPICRAALALNPEGDNRAKLTYLPATSLAATGQPEEAVPWYRAALKDNPDQLQSQLGLAKALGHLRRFGEAWEVAARAGRPRPGRAGRACITQPVHLHQMTATTIS